MFYVRYMPNLCQIMSDICRIYVSKYLCKLLYFNVIPQIYVGYPPTLSLVELYNVIQCPPFRTIWLSGPHESLSRPSVLLRHSKQILFHFIFAPSKCKLLNFRLWMTIQLQKARLWAQWGRYWVSSYAGAAEMPLQFFYILMPSLIASPLSCLR